MLFVNFCLSVKIVLFIKWDKFHSSGIFPSAITVFTSFVNYGKIGCCEDKSSLSQPLSGPASFPFFIKGITFSIMLSVLSNGRSSWFQGNSTFRRLVYVLAMLLILSCHLTPLTAIVKYIRHDADVICRACSASYRQNH